MVDQTRFYAEVDSVTGIEINRSSIDLPSSLAATEALAEFVRFLFEEGYLTEDNLPVRGGYSRYLLNTEPVHSDGEEMRRPLEVVEGVFLERNYNKNGIKRKIRQLSRSVLHEEF